MNGSLKKVSFYNAQVNDVIFSKNSKKIYMSTSSGFHIVDVSNPKEPKLESSLFDELFVGRFVFANNSLIAYVCVGKSIQIINLSKSECPQVIGVIKTDTYMAGLTFYDNYLFTYGEGMKIIDVTDLSSFKVVAQITDSYVGGVVLSKDCKVAYIANFEEGLQVLNISNPIAPQIIGALDIDMSYITLSDDGKRVFISGDNLTIVDVSIPTQPKEISRTAIIRYGRKIELTNDKNIILVPCYQMGGVVIDISHLESPKVVSNIDASCFPDGAVIARQDNLVFLYGAFGLNTYYINQMDDSSSLFEVTSIESRSIDVCVDNDDSESFIYVLDHTEICVYKTNKPDKPVLIDSKKIKASAVSISISSNKDLILVGLRGDTGDGEVLAFDVRDPRRIKPLGRTIINDEPYSISISSNDQIAFIAQGCSGLLIINISDPLDLKIIGKYKSRGVLVAIALSKDNKSAYLSKRGEGMEIINISDPQNPKTISQFSNSVSNTECIVVSKNGRYAFISDRMKGLEVLDVSDPLKPVLVAYLRLVGEQWRVVMSNDETKLYIATGSRGMVVVYIANPSKPVIIDSIASKGVTHNISLSTDNKLAYMSNSGGSVQIVRI